MNLQTIRGKKSLKLIFLLFTSLLIGAASAATYSYLFMNGTITVGTQQLVWIKDGTIVSGSTVAMSFSVQSAIPQWFNQSLYLKNVDGSSHNATISVTTTTLASDFTYANMYTYDANSTSLLHTFDLTTTNTYMFASSLDTNYAYLLNFGINATASAFGSYTFNIQVVYQ
jgi:hypothetical protein